MRAIVSQGDGAIYIIGIALVGSVSRATTRCLQSTKSRFLAASRRGGGSASPEKSNPAFLMTQCKYISCRVPWVVTLTRNYSGMVQFRSLVG